MLKRIALLYFLPIIIAMAAVSNGFCSINDNYLASYLRSLMLVFFMSSAALHFFANERPGWLLFLLSMAGLFSLAFIDPHVSRWIDREYFDFLKGLAPGFKLSSASSWICDNIGSIWK